MTPARDAQTGASLHDADTGNVLEKKQEWYKNCRFCRDKGCKKLERIENPSLSLYTLVFLFVALSFGLSLAMLLCYVMHRKYTIDMEETDRLKKQAQITM